MNNLTLDLIKTGNDFIKFKNSLIEILKKETDKNWLVPKEEVSSWNEKINILEEILLSLWTTEDSLEKLWEFLKEKESINPNEMFFYSNHLDLEDFD